jgi:hypothetical protein
MSQLALAAPSAAAVVLASPARSSLDGFPHATAASIPTVTRVTVKQADAVLMASRYGGAVDCFPCPSWIIRVS